MTYYYIRQDKNRECDDKKCGGETVIQYNDEGQGGWKEVMSVEPFQNLNSLNKFRKW